MLDDNAPSGKTYGDFFKDVSILLIHRAAGKEEYAVSTEIPDCNNARYSGLIRRIDRIISEVFNNEQG